MQSEIGKWIIIAGACIMVVGVIVYFFHDSFRWFGRLPGDIRIEKENVRFYFPITTMIIISVVLTILFRLLRKWL